MQQVGLAHAAGPVDEQGVKGRLGGVGDGRGGAVGQLVGLADDEVLQVVLERGPGDGVATPGPAFGALGDQVGLAIQVVLPQLAAQAGVDGDSDGRVLARQFGDDGANVALVVTLDPVGDEGVGHRDAKGLVSEVHLRTVAEPGVVLLRADAFAQPLMKAVDDGAVCAY